MKAIFGKKRIKKPSANETVVQISGGESGQKELEELSSPRSRRNYFGIKDHASENFKSVSLRFDNPEFIEYDSNIFPIGTNRNSTITSLRSASDSFDQKNVMDDHDTSVSDNLAMINEVAGCKSKSPLGQRSENHPNSPESLTIPSEKLLLKKTEEISDFNFKKLNEINVIKDDSIQCKVERLVLGKEERRRPDTGKSSISDIDLEESQSGDCKKISKNLLSCVPLRHRRSVKKRPIQIQDEKKDEGFWSKKSFFNKARLVNFFLEKNESTSKRNKFIELNMTEKGDAKPKVLVERFVKPKGTVEFSIDNGNVFSIIGKFGPVIVPLEEDLATKLYFNDLWFYIIYLVLITTIAMSMMSISMYYFTNVTAKLFMDSENAPSNQSQDSFPGLRENGSKFGNEKTLRKSNTFEDFWQFAETTMIELFYWNFYHAGVNFVSGTEKDRKMFYENQILGVPRLRQVRVRDDSCKIHPKVKRFFDSCYSYYSPFTEETRPIKEGMENSTTATAWVYTNAEKLKTSYYWGKISVYGGGGYYLDLDSNKESTQEMIQELKQNRWLSKATRAIFIDFNLYNANVNLFCLCKIVLEFPPVGGIIPKADFHALKLIRYLTTFDFFILGCELLLVLFLFYFNWKLLKKGLQQRRAFFLSFWNYLDLTIVLLLCAFIILSIIRYASINNLIYKLEDRFYEYTEFNFVKEIQINFNNVTAALLFASWAKLFTFLTFNVTTLEFRKTLRRSLVCILGFLPMFLIMYLAFALLANLLFGNEVKDYSTVWYSFLSLFQAFMGEFQYNQIQESQQVLGPIFCIAFIFFIFFVFLNVFIAIVNNAYTKVKSEVTLVRPRVGEYAKTGITNLLTCCRLRKKLKKKTSVKKKLIFSEIRQALEMSGFTSDEIRIFFSKYNINVHNILDQNTRRKVMEDLELKRVNFETSEKEGELKFLRRRINNLSSRIDDMEMNLQPVIDKVDVLLDRFGSKKYS